MKKKKKKVKKVSVMKKNSRGWWERRREGKVKKVLRSFKEDSGKEDKVRSYVWGLTGDVWVESSTPQAHVGLAFNSN
jgi:hypothetical protein